MSRSRDMLPSFRGASVMSTVEVNGRHYVRSLIDWHFNLQRSCKANKMESKVVSKNLLSEWRSSAGGSV